MAVACQPLSFSCQTHLKCVVNTEHLVAAVVARNFNEKCLTLAGGERLQKVIFKKKKLKQKPFRMCFNFQKFNCYDSRSLKTK